MVQTIEKGAHIWGVRYYNSPKSGQIEMLVCDCFSQKTIKTDKGCQKAVTL